MTLGKTVLRFIIATRQRHHRSHMAKTSSKSSLRPSRPNDESKKRLKVLSLTDNAGWLLAVGNGLRLRPNLLQQLMNYGSQGEPPSSAISGSGNSPTSSTAVDGQPHGLTTFGLTGYSGGQPIQMQQHGLHVELDDMGMVKASTSPYSPGSTTSSRINHEGRYA